MPHPRNQVPSYRLHKQSGQAIVTLRLSDGTRKDVLLGPFGSPESKAEYARIVREWESSGLRGLAALPPGRGTDLAINEILVAYLKHADAY